MLQFTLRNGLECDLYELTFVQNSECIMEILMMKKLLKMQRRY